MSNVKSWAISPAVRDVGRGVCSAILSSFVLLVVFDVFGIATPVSVMAYLLIACVLVRVIHEQGGNEFLVTRGTTRRDVFLRKVLPSFAVWPAGILFLLVLPQFQQRQDYLLFFLAMTAGFMISSSVMVFFRTKGKLTVMVIACLTFIALSVLQRNFLPSLLETIVGSVIMATIASLLLVVAYRRFLTMEVV